MNSLSFKKIRNQDLVKQTITNILSKIQNHLNSTILIGSEIEFYFHGDIEKLGNILLNNSNIKNIIIGEIKKEDGDNQYEICFVPQHDPIILANNIELTKQELRKISQKNNFEIDFSAKPYHNQPGSGLHFHISLYKNNINIFSNDNSILMLHAIAGLCHTMKGLMILFNSCKKDYLRISPYYNAPTTVSWGGNNRTVAIRIPCTGDNRRIEHRLAGANSDPYLVIMAILCGIDQGITNKLLPSERTYGIAYDLQYNLEKLPTNINDSLKSFRNFLKDYQNRHSYPLG